MFMTGQTKSLIPYAVGSIAAIPALCVAIFRYNRDVNQMYRKVVKFLVVNFAHVNDPRERFRVEIHLWAHNALPQNAVGHFLRDVLLRALPDIE